MFPTPFYKQRGLSLVELMVAMAISSFLILGVTQIYLDNKRNYIYQQGQGENLENGRFALMLISERLSKAGYRRNPDQAMDIAFPSKTVDGCPFSAGQAVVVREDDNALCLRYQPRDASETTCEGDTFSGSSNLNTPYGIDLNGLQTDFNPDENIVEIITLESGNLECNGQELVSNIEGLYFDYGVNDDAYTLKVDSYTNEPAAGDIIRALRYSILVVATPSNLTQGIESKVCSNPANEEDIGDWQHLTGQSLDCETGRLYQMLSSSTTMRNLMP